MTNVNKTVKLSNKDRNILVRAPFIGAGDDASALKLLEAAAIVTFDPRHILFRENDAAEHLYCVLNGFVRIYRLNKDGREADIRICGPGDTFNECLIFGSDRYRYNAQTAESTTLARFELPRIRNMIEQEPGVAKAVMQCLSNSLLNAMDCVANDRLQTAPQRVANYLITSGPHGATSYSLRLPFQKSLLAGKLGLAPEALSRAFSTLRQAGVTVRGRVVQVNDIGALRQI
jgi:CRP/FNR family transcriptional regulator, dissimilatory nitrate respiration regulator